MSKLGVHWIPIHGRPEDLDFIGQLQPLSVKIVNPDVQRVADVHRVAPQALIVVRDHPRSEQHDDVRMNPEATGVRHAEEFRRDIDLWRQQATERGLALPTDDQLLCPGLNEPHVWDMCDQVVRYYVAFLDRLTALGGLRGLALNLSVGWPGNHGPDTPPDWTPLEPIHAALGRGKHLLGLHEYWCALGPDNGWGWWAGRYTKCPWTDVEILIGECGVDEYVANGSVETHQRGWRAHLKPEEYMAQLGTYEQRLAQDPRIHSAQVFSTDGAREWFVSFDTAEIHALWVQYAQQRPIVAPVEPDALTRRARAVVAVNVRSAPGISQALLTTLQPCAQVATHGNCQQADGLTWWHITQPCIGWCAERDTDGTILLSFHTIRLPFAGNYPVTQIFGVNHQNYARFGLKGHNGIDYATPIGTNIVSVDDGRVAEVVDDPTGYGLYIKVIHGWGESLYAHLSQQWVNVGQAVVGGQTVGLSGNTGNSTGPHLHFGLRINPYDRNDGWSGYTDPASLL